MAKQPARWDVWFVAADQVYRGVPTDVAAGWAGAGRLAAGDRMRPAGRAEAWRKVADVPGVGGFLYRPPGGGAADAAELDLDAGPPPRRRQADDDEVDMIPLIDISLVLLVFFMMTTVAASMPAVDVPNMKYAQDMTKEASSLTVQIEKRGAAEVVYAVRVGDAAPETADANLPAFAELLARLDAKLSSRTTPPDVRIACQKEVDSAEVWKLQAELDKREKKGMIRSYAPEVTEAPK